MRCLRTLGDVESQDENKIRLAIAGETQAEQLLRLRTMFGSMGTAGVIDCLERAGYEVVTEKSGEHFRVSHEGKWNALGLSHIAAAARFLDPIEVAATALEEKDARS